MTGGDLVAASMRTIGALGSGETPTAAEAADGLATANRMLNSWKAERLMTFSITIQEFNLVPNQQVYTYGPGGDFDANRPVKIERVSIVSLTNPNQPQEIAIPYFTDWDWQSQPVKTGITTALPLGVYDNGNFPLRGISVQYTPSTISALRFYVWQQLDRFPDLVTDITYPEAYEEAILYNLAKRLMIEMPGEYATATVNFLQEQAVESLARVKIINMPIIQAFCDRALVGVGGHYNFYTDSITGQRN